MFTPKAFNGRWVLLLAGDLMLSAVGSYLALGALAPGNINSLTSDQIFMLITVLGALWLMALYFRDLYTFRIEQSRTRVATAVMSAALVMSLLTPAIAMAVPMFNLGRRYYIAEIVVTMAVLVVWRLAWARYCVSGRRTGVLIVGNGEASRVIADLIEEHSHLGYRLAGMVGVERPVSRMVAQGGGGSLVEAAAIPRLAEMAPDVTTIVITNPETPTFATRDLLRWRMQGHEVLDFESFYERLTGKLALALIREAWLVFAPGGGVRSGWRERVKRAFDLSASALLAVVAMPLGLVTVLAIKIESRGPVLYRQDRVGQDNRVFRIVKFRSMREDAERASGPVWAVEDDPRITRVGRIIRRLRIDELPQLINVLRGDMSLIGPRPERPELVAKLAAALPLYEYRHCVKPGLTGWAQICYRYGASSDDAAEKLCFDLYYVKNWSLTLDLQIVLQTTKVVLSGRGAR